MVAVPPFNNGSGSTWDVRTVDMWIYQLDNLGNTVNSWNILEGFTPAIPAGTKFICSVRLKNFGTQNVNVKLATQAVGHLSGNLGQVIYTNPSGLLGAGATIVLAQTITMWSEPVDLRNWVVNNLTGSPTGSGNAPAGAAPPWSTNYAQGELFDYALSSRHVTALQVIGMGSAPNNSVQVFTYVDGEPNPIPNATVQLINANGSVALVQNSDVSGSVIFQGLPAGTYSVQAQASGWTFQPYQGLVIPTTLIVKLSGTSVSVPTGPPGLTPPPSGAGSVPFSIRVYDQAATNQTNGTVVLIPNINVTIDGAFAGVTNASGTLSTTVSVAQHSITLVDPTGKYVSANITANVTEAGQTDSVGLGLTSTSSGGGGTGGNNPPINPLNPVSNSTLEVVGIVIAIVIVIALLGVGAKS
jgi:hypothetical protein